MKEMAIGLHRTILDNGWWVNTVRVPTGVDGRFYHTVVYDRQGLWAPVWVLRSECEDEWRKDHLAAVDWAGEQPRRAVKKQKGQAFGPRKDAA